MTDTAALVDLADRLTTTLQLATPPVAITFASADRPHEEVPAFDAPMPAPTEDGRTGRVAAGCVFWVHADRSTFRTTAEDHANCSVGSVTHGFLPLAEAAGNADVVALVESGWVSVDTFPSLPVVAERPAAVVYGPLADAGDVPDVVLVRLNGAGLMTLMDAEPGLRVEGKPQCHIVALAREQGIVAASTGCALSRARTGMRHTEMTAAVPGTVLADLVERLEAAAAANTIVTRYAGEDAARFRPVATAG